MNPANDQIYNVGGRIILFRDDGSLHVDGAIYAKKDVEAEEKIRRGDVTKLGDTKVTIAALGQSARRALPDDWGFVIVAFPYGTPDKLYMNASVSLEDVPRVLSPLIENIIYHRKPWWKSAIMSLLFGRSLRRRGLARYA